MRGSDATSGSLFSYVDLESRVPAKHPLRVIKAIVDDVLVSLDAEFARLYEGTGRASIAPERLLRASLLQAFYSVRSERQLMEQIDYNLLFRWFVGVGIDDPVWDHSVFSKNRDRLLDAEVAAKFLEAVLRHPKVKRFLSEDHFSVDGTLVEAWASLKSLRAKDGSDEPPTPGRNGERDFHGEKRANDTHESTTDPEAKLYRKGNSQPAKLYFMGHALIENRHGLVVQADATQANGTAERAAALDMIDRQDPGSERRLTLGADKGYDTSDFVADLRRKCVTPHVAQKIKGSAIDARTTRHDGYAESQRKRKRVEEPFGWAKTIAGMAKVKVRGLARVRHAFTFAMAAYNLIRMPRLLAAAA
ncbi:transposase [Hyphomicrobium nitrativorans NL23]|uniref:Transposase n=1 Tax=Hyphomicrobium nitrativorans NL23 TaxID=1029756 RepID=V5SB29_9HYPH|nr:IS5 family transposase [Hyphomicrobium nitrativorans]AHB48051.1 transposase [Hyphomicrobium nitrativorans NL23]